MTVRKQEEIERLKAENERLQAACNYAVKELSFMDCGSAPLEELARRAKAGVETLSAALDAAQRENLMHHMALKARLNTVLAPTIELLSRVIIGPGVSVKWSESPIGEIANELARLKAIVEKGTE